MTTQDINHKLVCGLGNPLTVAPELSLHNVGFMAVDELAREYSADPNQVSWRETDSAMCLDVNLAEVSFTLVKPLHIDINSSGVPVRALAQEYNCKPENIIIIHDDLDVSLGQVKFKQGVSSDRHNGVKSIKEELQSENFLRIKGGVGKPSNKEISLLDWVKGPIEENMLPHIIKLVSELCDILKITIKNGVEAGRGRASKIAK